VEAIRKRPGAAAQGRHFPSSFRERDAVVQSSGPHCQFTSHQLVTEVTAVIPGAADTDDSGSKEQSRIGYEIIPRSGAYVMTGASPDPEGTNYWVFAMRAEQQGYGEVTKCASFAQATVSNTKR
jgi:hypothetical protein